MLARLVTTLVLPKVLEKATEKLGELIGDSAFKKSSEMVQLILAKLQKKLQSAGSIGLLNQAEEEPTEYNTKALEAELVNQMEDDKEFAEQLEGLIQQIQSQSPTLQAVLDNVRLKGSAKIGNVEQVIEGKSAEQVVGRNLEVDGDLEIGDVTQTIYS